MSGKVVTLPVVRVEHFSAKTVYPRDIELLVNLQLEVRAAFDGYMKELDTEHERQGSPYGEGSLWQLTGGRCWFHYFEDGYSAAEAWAKDWYNAQ